MCTKKLLMLSLLALAGISISTTPQAAVKGNTLDISVTGTITPSSCSALLAGGNEIDLGTIESSLLEKDQINDLPVKTVNLSIVCDAPTKVALLTTDNRASTAAARRNGIFYMGLGDDSKGNHIGGWAASIANESVTLSGHEGAQGLMSADNGVSWIKASAGAFIDNSQKFYSWSDDGIAPSAFKNLQAELTILSFVAPTSELDLTEAISLDGSASVQLYYL